MENKAGEKPGQALEEMLKGKDTSDDNGVQSDVVYKKHFPKREITVSAPGSQCGRTMLNPSMTHLSQVLVVICMKTGTRRLHFCLTIASVFPVFFAVGCAI